MTRSPISDAAPISGPNHDATARRSRRRRRVLVIALAALGSPVMAELALRATGAPGVVLHRELGRRLAPGDGALRHVLKPNHRTRVVYSTRDGRELRSVVMSGNELGMRNPLPRGGRPRIACLGDSHTYGFGVADHSPWPRVLERQLVQHGVRNAEVLNFAVGAYETDDELEHLRRNVLHHEPDVVLLQWFMNDARLQHDILERTGLQRRVMAWCHPFQQGALGKLRTTSRLVDYGMQAAYGWARRDGEILARNGEQLADTEGWRLVRDSILEARRLTETRGAHFAVVLHPLMTRDGDHFASRPIDNHVRALCTRESITCIDLAEHLDPREAHELRNTDLDYHPSAKCHAKVGVAVAKELLRLGWASEDRIDEGRDDRNGLDEHQNDRSGQQEQQKRREEPVRSVEQATKQLTDGAAAGGDGSE